MAFTVAAICSWSSAPAQGGAAGRGAQAGVGGQLAGLGLGDPLADDGGVGSGVERRPVLGELLIAGADLFPEADQFARDGVVLAGGEGFDRGGQAGGVE